MNRSPLLCLCLAAALLGGCSEKSKEETPPVPLKAEAPTPVIPEQPAVETPKTLSHYVKPTAELRQSDAQSIERAVSEAIRNRKEAADRLLVEAFVPTEKRVYFRSGDTPVPAAEAQSALREALPLVENALTRYRRLSDQQLKEEVRLRFETKREGESTIFEAKGLGKNLRRLMSTAEGPSRNEDRASLIFQFIVSSDGTAESEFTFDYRGALELKPKALHAETSDCAFPIPLPAGRTVSTEVLSDGAKRGLFTARWDEPAVRTLLALLLDHRRENGALTVRGEGTLIDVYGLNVENRRLLTEAVLLFAVLKEKEFFSELVKTAN